MRSRTLLVAALQALLVANLCAQERRADNWASFRGPHASGVAEGQNLPEKWDAGRGVGVRWKTPIPGLAHSSPIVWGDTLYVTSAISSRGNATFKPGLYGDGDASDDRSRHRWMLYAIDKRAPFNPETTAPENKRFTAARLAAGATMLRDLWWTAWVTSAPTAADSARARR